jgi:alpha-tubulin suppressor-like RCC1 family protein
MALGDAHVCAITLEGDPLCWGRNNYGQLGREVDNYSETPSIVTDLEDATQIACGPWHCCAVLADTTVRCWGSNEFGALGDGTTENRTVPVEVRVP